MCRNVFKFTVLLVAALAGLPIQSLHGASPTNSGLVLSIRPNISEDISDTLVVPNLALYVVAGSPPTTFCKPGSFHAVWEGFVNAELRGEFYFAAEFNGTLAFEINNATVLSGSATNGALPRRSAGAVRLNKGANKLKASFASGDAGDAFLRVGWTEKGTNVAPIPASVFTHGPSDALLKREQLHLGRDLFIERRCIRCHTVSTSELGPELDMDAPSFEGVGSRLRLEWIERWIFNPKAMRRTSLMPKVLHGVNATNDARAIASYLSTLKTPAEKTPGDAAVSGDKPLFERLLCTACHSSLSLKLPLDHVAEKFQAGALQQYLLAPEAHYTWTRMPNFKLSPAEANELANFLVKDAKPPDAIDSSTDAAVANGKKLVESVGCLNCHSPKLAAPVNATKLSASNWQRGCLAKERAAQSKAPDFQFSEEDRAALQAFGGGSLDPLSRQAPFEFALANTRLLNCNACHGSVEGFPALGILGEKLHAEWMARFISGQVPYKPRSEKHPAGEAWLEARMPAFEPYGKTIAEGLAALHGYGPTSSNDGPADAKLAELGRKLVGKDNGFSCISCHGAGKLKAMEVFEAEGIDFAYSAERLLPEYYRRWMRNPLAIDPQTKMPAYFEDGRSPLTEVLDGDAEKQIDAIWHYLKLGQNMPLPAIQPSQ